MIDDRRAALIRAALAPDQHVAAPGDLGAVISAEIRQTPQRRRSWLGRIDVVPRSGQVRLVLLLGALLLAIVIALGVASRLRTPPPSIDAYHGPPSRTGVMPGPAPHATPAELWRATLGGPVGVLGMPLVVDETVLASDDRGVLTAVTEAGGVLLWTTAVDRPGTISLAVVGDVVIAASERGRLSAIRRATGATTWTVPLAGAGLLSVVVDGGVIVGASVDRHVYGVDPRDGHVVWVFEVPGAVNRGAALKDGLGVVGDETGQVTAFDLASGTVRWTADLGPGEITTPAIDAGLAFVAHGFADGSRAVLVAFDLATGRERWRWTLPNDGRLFVGAVADGSIVALDDLGTAWAIDVATGSATTLYRARGAFGSVGAIVGTELILTSADGEIVAVDRQTGAVHWSVHVVGVPTTPSVINGRVFVATDDGVLRAIGNPRP